MMNIYTMILSLAVILTIGIDYLHFDEVISSAFKRMMTKGKLTEPFRIPVMSCSTCSTHWIGLMILICTGTITIYTYLYLLVISMSTPIIAEIVAIILDIIMMFLGKIREKMN